LSWYFEKMQAFSI